MPRPASSRRTNLRQRFNGASLGPVYGERDGAYHLTKMMISLSLGIGIRSVSCCRLRSGVLTYCGTQVKNVGSGSSSRVSTLSEVVAGIGPTLIQGGSLIAITPSTYCWYPQTRNKYPDVLMSRYCQHPSLQAEAHNQQRPTQVNTLGIWIRVGSPKEAIPRNFGESICAGRSYQCSSKLAFIIQTGLPILHMTSLLFISTDEVFSTCSYTAESW